MAEANGAVGGTGDYVDGFHKIMCEERSIRCWTSVSCEERSSFYGSNRQCVGRSGDHHEAYALLFLDNVHSERELMRIVPLSLDYVWFLGYGLEDEIPNDSVLSKARKRWERRFSNGSSPGVSSNVSRRGLVDGRKLYVDASLVGRESSRNSVIEVVVRREVSKLEGRGTGLRKRGLGQ